MSKVITLLKDMLKQLEKEADEDQEVYEKFSCWCTTNDKETTCMCTTTTTRVRHALVVGARQHGPQHPLAASALEGASTPSEVPLCVVPPLLLLVMASGMPA